MVRIYKEDAGKDLAIKNIRQRRGWSRKCQRDSISVAMQTTGFMEDEYYKGKVRVSPS